MSTFTRVTIDYDPTTDTSTSVTTTITGSSLSEMRGDEKAYKSLNLVETTSRTLFFVPTEYGDCPKPGDSIVWLNKRYTVKLVKELAPDGVVVAAYVIVGR